MLLDGLADRLADPREPSCRDAGEHPVHHRPLQRIAVSEVLVGRDRRLPPVDRPHPRTADRNTPAAERHRPGLVAVPARRALGVPLPLRPDDLVDLGFHQLVHDPQADADAQREQPLSPTSSPRTS